MNNMNQNGRSMIEMLGVLAIIGVLSVGGIAGYSKAMLKYKTNKTIDEVTMLVTNIRTLYAQQKTYDAALADYAKIKSLGVVPDEMDNGSKLVNAFSGDVNVAKSDSHASGDDRAFTVTVKGLPKEACMAITTSDWGSNYSSGLLAMGVDTGTGTSYSTSAAYSGNCTTTLDGSTADKSKGIICAKDMPMKVNVASKACSSVDNNVVQFKYY